MENKQSKIRKKNNKMLILRKHKNFQFFKNEADRLEFNIQMEKIAPTQKPQISILVGLVYRAFQSRFGLSFSTIFSKNSFASTETQCTLSSMLYPKVQNEAL